MIKKTFKSKAEANIMAARLNKINQEERSQQSQSQSSATDLNGQVSLGPVTRLHTIGNVYVGKISTYTQKSGLASGAINLGALNSGGSSSTGSASVGSVHIQVVGAATLAEEAEELLGTGHRVMSAINWYSGAFMALEAEINNANNRRAMWGSLVLGGTFIIAFLIAWVKFENVWEALAVALVTATMGLISLWRWSQGYPASLFPGKRIDSTPEEDLDGALRKMREKGEKL